MIRLYLGIKSDIYFNMGKQNDKLIKNLERYEQKEKAKQQESKIHGQKPVKQIRRGAKTRVHNS